MASDGAALEGLISWLDLLSCSGARSAASVEETAADDASVSGAAAGEVGDAAAFAASSVSVVAAAAAVFCCDGVAASAALSGMDKEKTWHCAIVSPTELTSTPVSISAGGRERASATTFAFP